MKLNLESSKTNVCKEDTLLCIIKDVPNFVQEEGEISTVGGSHQDIILLEKQSSPLSFSNVSSDSKKSFTIKKHVNEINSEENITMKLYGKKPKKQIKVKCSSEELRLFSTASEESLISEEDLPGITKKRKKKTKRNYRSFANPNLTLSIEYLKTPEIKIRFDDRYTSSDELCSDCLWLVRTAKQLKISSSSEDDDEFLKKWNQKGKKQLLKSNLNNSIEKNLDVKVFTEKDVLQILKEVHSRLIECSIILTTHKLNKKVKKSTRDDSLDKEYPETLSDEKLLDEIQEEEGTRNGTSKLCLILGKLVSKFLKTQ